MKCGCSKCVDEFTGEKLLKESDVPVDVVPTNIDYEVTMMMIIRSDL